MAFGLDRQAGAEGPVVTGFSDNGFRVGEAVYPHGLLLTPTAAVAWAAPAIDALDEAALRREEAAWARTQRLRWV